MIGATVSSGDVWVLCHFNAPPQQEHLIFFPLCLLTVGELKGGYEKASHSRLQNQGKLLH
jgi:hypothetical protein